MVDGIATSREERVALDRPPLSPAGTYRRPPLPPHAMTEAVTPAADLFVLAHLGVPRLDPQTWRLRVGGLVRRPLDLTLADLRGRPRRTVQTFHQCAGNPLEPTVPTRRVANVVWGGVPLASLLDEAGIRPEARYAWSYGLDHGRFAGVDLDHYLKDLPLARLAEGDVLVADEVNGAALSAEHGAPARLVVPGFYGTNSVKWLSRIELAATRAGELFTTGLYNDPVSGADGVPTTRPVWAIPVESLIVAPGPDARIALGRETAIWGWAWADSGVAAVEVDDGSGWRPARVEPRVERAWQRFSLPWRPAGGPGPLTLRARATARDGAVQPEASARNAVHAVDVTLISSEPCRGDPS